MAFDKYRSLVAMAIVLIIGLALLTGTAAALSSMLMLWSTSDGGGTATSIGSQYMFAGTVGQIDASGTVMSDRYAVIGGFWGAVQTPGQYVPMSPVPSVTFWGLIALVATLAIAIHAVRRPGHRRITGS